MSVHKLIPTAVSRTAETANRQVARLLLVVSHHTLAAVGLAAMLTGLLVYGRPDWRQAIEQSAYGWLHERHGAAAAPVEPAAPAAETMPLVADASAVTRATATDLEALSEPQVKLAQWISRRYKVAPEPIGRLVQEAWDAGAKFGVEPTLILAIMAVESSFNPFAQSHVGAQGLMQVMTRIHDKKYEAFGGVHAAFDPVTNLHVGVQVLKECIARAGSIPEGLRHYVGAANLPTDGGYASKVLGEHRFLKDVAAGKAVPHTARVTPVAAPLRTASTTDAIARTLAGEDVALADAPPATP